MVPQISDGESQGFVVIVRCHSSFDSFFVRMQPVAMGKAVCGIVPHNRYPVLALPEAALQLNGKLEDPPALQLEPCSQGIVSVQKAVKFDFSHAGILPV